MRSLPTFVLATILTSGCDRAAVPTSETADPRPESAALNPVIQEIVASLSEDRIEASLRRLEGFGTRHILSGELGPERGIDAARDWLVQELSGYDPRLEVSVQPFRLPAGTADGQVLRDVEVANVIAVLPGTTEPGTGFSSPPITTLCTITASQCRPTRSAYGSSWRSVRWRKRKPAAWSSCFRVSVLGEPDAEATAADEHAPGVSDDGSGVAAMLELARVMSQHRFEKTLVFVAFAAEEVALEGSKFYATQAKKDGATIEAVLNNDIIGSVRRRERPREQ